MISTHASRWMLPALLLTLAACGGGGGGGSSEARLSVSADRSSLQFTTLNNSSSLTEQINFSVTNASGTLYARVEPDRPAAFGAGFSFTGDTTGTLSLTIVNAAAASDSGSISLKLCGDANCAAVVWSMQLPYTLKRFTLDTRALALQGIEGQTSAAQTLALNAPDPSNLLRVFVSQGSSWLQLSRDSAGRPQVQADASQLKPGSYNGLVAVTLTSATGTSPAGLPVAVPVSLTVGTAMVASTPAVQVLNVNSGNAELTGSVPLNIPAGLNLAWSASSSAEWLQVLDSQGQGTANVRYRMDPAALARLPNWQDHEAQLRIRAGTLSELVVPVRLSKRLPEIWAASPNVIAADAPASVLLMGRGLAQAGALERLQLGGLSLANGLRASLQADNLVRVELPAQAAGSLAARAGNGLGESTLGTSLGVAARGALSATFVAERAERRAAVFDPTRQALFSIDLSNQALLKFWFAAGQWRTQRLLVNTVGNLALAPDRGRLYVGSGHNKLLEVDPDTLTVMATHEAPYGEYGPSLYHGMLRSPPYAVTADQRIWFTGNQHMPPSYFNLINRKFETASFDNLHNYNLHSPLLFASGDGRRLLFANATLSPTPPLLHYDALANGSVRIGSPDRLNTASFSHDGNLLLQEDRLLRSQDDSLLGLVQLTRGIALASLLSPDGRRVYVLASQDLNSLRVDRVEVFDTAQLAPGSGRLLNVGSIAVPAQAAQCSSNSYDCDPVGLFVVSPLGDTLFWLGNQGLLVLPVGESLQGLASSGTLRRAR